MPQSLMGPLMTAVPASVILNLIGEKYRVSVQKQFAAKEYPDWYKVSRTSHDLRYVAQWFFTNPSDEITDLFFSPTDYGPKS